MKSPIQVVSTIYEAFRESNMSKGLLYIDQDFFVNIPEFLPFGGLYQGRHGFISMLRGVFRFWYQVELVSVIYFIPDERSEKDAHEFIVAQGDMKGIAHKGKKTAKISFLHYWHIKNEKAISLRSSFWSDDIKLGYQK